MGVRGLSSLICLIFGIFFFTSVCIAGTIDSNLSPGVLKNNATAGSYGVLQNISDLANINITHAVTGFTVNKTSSASPISTQSSRNLTRRGNTTSGTIITPMASVSPPTSPVKLIFIHHSTGEHWLNDDNGGLGIALRDNNYFVSDTNYGWGPDSIGSYTDIGNWWTWFRGPSSQSYMDALFDESGQWSEYSRLSTDPGGQNKIVMFKSCFPNSNLQGDPSDPIPDIDENPLKGEDSSSPYHTISNAKGIYIDILNYFRTKPDTLFILVTAPPLSSSEYSSNARLLNQWLFNDWLTGYSGSNVFVFDFYNVLTTNGGDVNTNDLGFTTGNHHRWWNGGIQHQVDMAFNTSAYPSSDSDDHPTMAGNLKATSEYIPLLNYAYNRWINAPGGAPVADFTTNRTSGRSPLCIQFNDTSIGGTPTAWNWSFGDNTWTNMTNPDSRNVTKTYITPGNYTAKLLVSNSAGQNITVPGTNITVLPPDSTPPNSVTNLTNQTYLPYSINWTWTDPANSDFNRVMIYLNGQFRTNVTKGIQYYNATSLIPNTRYIIGTRTVNNAGDINQTWVNHTTYTIPPPTIISTSPSIGYPIQNWPVTINGTNFRSNASVVINNSTISKSGEIVSLSSTHLVCIFPVDLLAPGVYDITVRNEDLTYAKISQEIGSTLISFTN